MWVIKLGGSLGDEPVLRQWLAALAQWGKGNTVDLAANRRVACRARRARQGQVRCRGAHGAPYALSQQDWRGGVVIVPGGGAFADQVRSAQRHWRFDETTAHRMAIVAMQQMALLFRGLNAGLHIAGSTAEINATLAQNQTALWSPDYHALDRAGIAATWDITSDSLAAWLAGELGASGLILVKSAALPEDADLSRLGDAGIVDAAFGAFAARLNCPVKLFHRDQLRACMNYMALRRVG